MLNTEPEIKNHPTYKRKWYIYCASYWIPFIIIYICFLLFGIKKGYFLHDPILGTLLFLGFIWFIGSFFYPSTKCPECGDKTKFYKNLENKNRSRVCKSCSIIWDLEISQGDD